MHLNRRSDIEKFNGHDGWFKNKNVKEYVKHIEKI